MCRGENTCSELGIEIEKWSRKCPLPYPKWVDNQIDIFLDVVDSFISGNKKSCLSKLKEIQSEKITLWFVEHGQMSGRHRNIQLKKPQPHPIDKSMRDPERSPKKLQNSVFERDGYKCRYCGNKLISQDFIRLFIKKLNSPFFKRGDTNLTTHGIIHLSWPVADHVIPWNLGGKTNLSNLISSCASCNYGKDGYTIEQLGISNPFNRVPIIDKWDGLVSKIPKLKSL